MPRQRYSHAGIELAYADEGAGATVLLVHGFPLDRAMWDDQVESLARDFRVLAPDLRGFGDSGIGPDDAEAGVAMTTYSDDLAALLDAAGVDEPVVLAGFSMGGYVGWQFALNYADRLRALVACDTRAIADTPEAAANRQAMASEVLAAGNSAAAEAMAPKLLAPRTLKFGGETVARLMTMIRRATPAGVAAAQRGMAARPDVRDRLSEIACPALVVVGEEDAISSPEEMAEIAAALPDANYATIPAAGHMSPMENPADFNAVVRQFLDDLD